MAPCLSSAPLNVLRVASLPGLVFLVCSQESWSPFEEEGSWMYAQEPRGRGGAEVTVAFGPLLPETKPEHLYIRKVRSSQSVLSACGFVNKG